MDTRTEMPHHRRVAARAIWWRRGLYALYWVVSVGAVGLMLREGGLLIFEPLDYVYTAGRAAGILAAVAMLTQVLLASRAPWIERALGHDRAMVAHTRLGRWAIIGMITHWLLITAMTAWYSSRSVVDVTLSWGDVGVWMLGAQMALTVFLVILVTSLVAVRRRWRYERWHTVHLLVYVGAAAAIPHQFLHGTTFLTHPNATMWLTLYVIAFGSLLFYRLVRPVWLYFVTRPRVTAVRHEPDGSTTVTVGGAGMERWKAEPGQFFLWRFLAPGHYTQAHPYSLSAAPHDSLRITVKPSGDGSASVRDIPVGTPVLIEGPLGRFTNRASSGTHMLLIAAGIGITPIRSLLEARSPDDQTTVVFRIRNQDEAPLVEEVTELARKNGADLHVLSGPRGESWGSREHKVTMDALVRNPDQTDVYICGPLSWADEVEKDARAAGVPQSRIHREAFAW